MAKESSISRNNPLNVAESSSSENLHECKPSRLDNHTLVSVVPHKRSLPQELCHGKNDSATVGDAEVEYQYEGEPSPKRLRAAEWPLKNNTAPIISHQVSHLTTSKSHKVASAQHSNPASRPSKFLEGSLNDKPSSKPPDAFLGSEDLMEQYSKNQGAGVDSVDAANLTDTIKTRPIAVHRFGRLGKAFTNILKPTTMWQGINGMWRDKEQAPQSNSDAVIDQRKAKVVAAYAELKKANFRGVQSSGSTSSSQAEPKAEGDQVLQNHRNSFRDSAIDVEADFLPIQDPHASDKVRIEKVSSDSKEGEVIVQIPATSSRRVSSLNLRPAPLQGVKKVKSQSQLPTTKQAGHPRQRVYQAQRKSAEIPTTERLLRQQSKKDLSRQQKLSKRVSDLETKLQLARQELEHSLQDAPPVPGMPNNYTRAPFVPSALPSLPSERLLVHQGTNAADESQSSYPRNLKIDHASRASTQISAPEKESMLSPSAQLHNELKRSVRNEELGGKHNNRTVSSEEVMSESRGQQKSEALSAAAAVSFDKRRLIQSRSSSASSTAIPRDLKPRENQTQVLRCESLDKTTGFIPGIPEIPAAIDNAKTRSSSPFLSRPVPLSPMRTRSKSSSHKGGTSPPPPSLASAKKRRVTFLLDPETPEKDHRARKSLRKTPLDVSKNAQRKLDPRVKDRVSSLDKPLPDIQKEDFEWDADVF